MDIQSNTTGVLLDTDKIFVGNRKATELSQVQLYVEALRLHVPGVTPDMNKMDLVQAIGAFQAKG